MPAGSALWTRRRWCAGSVSVGLLAAVLAAAPGCGSAPESGGGFGGMSEGDLAIFRNMEPIGGEERSPAEATAVFMEFDANADGMLEPAELSSQMQSLIARADADGDGMASEEEILALLTREAAETAEIAETDETP